MAALQSSAPQLFPFPREYHFPAFFTRQTNLTTLHAQLTKWSTLILSYCRHHRIFKLSLSPSSTTLARRPSPNPNNPPSSSLEQGTTLDTSNLFHNPRLNRTLSIHDIREVIDFMRKENRAEYVSSAAEAAAKAGNLTDETLSKIGDGGDLVWVYWRTPEEWAAVVEEWVDETGQRGSVLTVYELLEGEASRGTEFHGMDQEILLKALQVLVKRGKAQIFGQEDSRGVKIF